MEEFLQEKVDIKTQILQHFLQGEWETAHEKAFALLQKEPENIEFLVLFIYVSSYGRFDQDTINYGKKALLWAEDNGKDIKEFNSLEMSATDIREFVARAYFGLQDYSSVADELDKIKETLGQLPDNIKELAVRNEYKLNGTNAALNLAEQLTSIFEKKESEIFCEFKMIEAQICFFEITALAGGCDFPENLQVAIAQKIAEFLLRLVNCLEDIDENYLDKDSDVARERKILYEFGKEWLPKVLIVLYQGESEDEPEMKANNHYPAAQECLMVLEKLADMGNVFAMGMLGDLYASACNVEQDDVKAFNYYKQAYEHGEKSAGANLALYYDEGTVVERDLEKALEYAKKAAETETGKAYVVLGQIYADSMGNVEQGLIWLKKANEKGYEFAKNVILRLARENINDFDEKLQFILDINERMKRDIESLDSQLELGRKYVKYYMEIEKYYIAPPHRMEFIVFCANAQPETLLSYGGFVSVEYFGGQLEKCLQEEQNQSRRVQIIRTIAKRADSLFSWEMVQVGAKEVNISYLGWERVCRYIYDRLEILGWDGRMEDGEMWQYFSFQYKEADHTSSQREVQNGIAGKPNTSGTLNTYSNANNSSGGCYVATAVYGSYDCSEVWTLRRYRDYKLARTFRGRIFIKAYYAVSPTIVKWAGDTQWFKKIWRRRLDKMVKVLRDEGFDSTPYEDKDW